MQIKAVSKYNKISARKVRLVADMVRGEKALQAFDILKFTPKKAARLVEKTLKSAVANAENNHGADKKDLIIKTLLVDEGPTIKRYQPRSKGMANTIRKRTSHVTVVVESADVKKEKVQKKDSSVTKDKDSNSKND